MPTEPLLEPLSEKHRKGVIAIYNHYVDHGYACYRETHVPEAAFDRYLEMAKGYPAYASVDDNGRVTGFGFLHAYHPSECFRRTAEATYFLHPDATHQGLGSRMLQRLLAEAASQGITRVLASISSRNPESLAFHRKHGFVECGRLPGVGCKRGADFDVVWMIREM